MTNPTLDHDSSILIVGAGTWGCSTALHLARRGYRDVRVLDPFIVPSPIAAGNDINKIMEHKEFKENYQDAKAIAVATFSRAALKGWKTDPVFTPYFHETGFILAATNPGLIAYLKEEEIDPMQADFQNLQTPSEFRSTMPSGVLTGEFPGWQGWASYQDAGWIHARKGIISAATEAQRLGVNFITGSPQGHVIELVYQDGDVKGAKTADGKLHLADHTILAAGAGSDQLLDFEKQLRPTAWTISHIKLTPEEARRYRNLPVLYNPGMGFFIEPDEDKHELKICDEHPGYCNFVADWQRPGEERSKPFAKEQIPLEAEARARRFLQDTMPHLADRPLSFARICWDADTVDRRFLIDRHPDYASLVVAVGGSGDGAMQMPSIGGFIVDALEGKLQDEVRDVVRWRPQLAINRDWYATQNRHGGRHEVMNLQDIKDDEWTCVQ